MRLKTANHMLAALGIPVRLRYAKHQERWLGLFVIDQGVMQHTQGWQHVDDAVEALLVHYRPQGDGETQPG